MTIFPIHVRGQWHFLKIYSPLYWSCQCTEWQLFVILFLLNSNEKNIFMQQEALNISQFLELDQIQCKVFEISLRLPLNHILALADLHVWNDIKLNAEWLICLFVCFCTTDMDVVIMFFSKN